jgi:alkylated DNA repair dioxygenase AlkB
MTPLLEAAARAGRAATGRRYNSVLLNYYRDGADSMGMHSDDEPELGPQPVIASLSYGAARTFILRHKRSKRTMKLDLTDGSLLLMAGACSQLAARHQQDCKTGWTTAQSHFSLHRILNRCYLCHFRY